MFWVCCILTLIRAVESDNCYLQTKLLRLFFPPTEMRVLEINSKVEDRDNKGDYQMQLNKDKSNN